VSIKTTGERIGVQKFRRNVEEELKVGLGIFNV
jgi:hypothetical protein